MNALEKLREVTDSIADAGNGLKIVDAWTLAGRLLSRFPVDAAESARVLKEQDHAGLDAIVQSLEHPEPKQSTSPTRDVTEADMKAAMRAFHKRLKLTRLDDESRLGGRYTSGGRKSQVDAIMPPTEFSQDVWNALVAAGRLIPVGKGFYADADNKPEPPV
ncbi:MAG: hypothetical protein AAGA55_10875 [Planctomycetota bacterium]